MSDLCQLIWCAMVGRVQSRAALQAEILILRHQLNVLRRKSLKRVVSFVPQSAGGAENPQAGDGSALASHEFPSVLALRSRGGRPETPVDIRQLIREMSVANPLWGAPRIHGELDAKVAAFSWPCISRP
jgi:hypothetical protein